MSALGSDRRIIRAFYTQYTAVLLIVLVFCVAAFQRSTVRPTTVSRTALVETSPRSIGVWEAARPLPLDDSFRASGSEFVALSEFLRSHDVRAKFVIAVSQVNFKEESSEIYRIMNRIRAISRFLVENGVPSSAMRFVVDPSGGDQPTGYRVVFEPQEDSHGY